MCHPIIDPPCQAARKCDLFVIVSRGNIISTNSKHVKICADGVYGQLTQILPTIQFLWSLLTMILVYFYQLQTIIRCNYSSPPIYKKYIPKCKFKICQTLGMKVLVRFTWTKREANIRDLGTKVSLR